MLQRMQRGGDEIEAAADAVFNSGASKGSVVEELLNLRNAADDLGRDLWDVENVSGVGHDDDLDAAWSSVMRGPELSLIGTLVLATERAMVSPREGVHGGINDRWDTCRQTARFLAERLRVWGEEAKQGGASDA